MSNGLAKSFDNALDIVICEVQAWLGPWDGLAIFIAMAATLADVLYPAYSTPAHLLIPNHAFYVITWLIALLFMIMFVFSSAFHWDGIDRLIRLCIGLVLLAVFVLMIVPIFNAAYASVYSTPPPAPAVSIA